MRYTVSFDLMGGELEADKPIKVTFGQAYGELPVPAKLNTEFIGWYDQREDGKEIDENTPVSVAADHILYARWKDVKADISYKNIRATDTNNNPKTYTFGESTLITEPERTGYEFLGWQVGDSEELVYTYEIPAESVDPVTFTANWKAREYTLSLYSYSGVYCVKTFECDADITKIALPKNNGYKLTGWKDMDSGEIIDKLPTKMPSKNLTLVSQWAIAEYSIIFNNMGLAKIDPVTYKPEDNSFTLQAPTTNRPGYDFVGWYSDATFSESGRIEVFTPVAYDFNVFAKWSPRNYTVIFNGNGGLADESDSYSVEFVYDQDGKLPANKFVNSGYNFGGWAVTSADAKERKVTYTDQQDIGATAGVNLYKNADDAIVNLFAVWNPLDYTIEYNDVVLIDGDSITATGQPNKTTYNIESKDEDYVLAPPTEIGEGYEFLGWYDGTGNDAKKIENLKVKGEKGTKTLYARWAHAGIYTLSKVSSTSESPTAGSVDDKTTFKITRKIPNDKNGVTVSTDPQKVYFRTVNGTLIGGTASPINFYHVGGQNVYAVFSDTECYIMDNNAKGDPQEVNSTADVSVTFDVKNENVSTRYYGDETPRETNGVFAQLYSIADRNDNKKYYSVELYRITSSQGNVTGTYGDSIEVKREMTVPESNRMTYNKLYGAKDYTIHWECWFDDEGGFKRLFDMGYLMTGSGDSIKFGNTVLTKNMMYYLRSAGGPSCNIAAQYQCGRTKGKGYATMAIEYFLNGQFLFKNSSNSSSPGSGTAWRGWTNKNITYDLLMKNNGKVQYRGDIDEDNITYVRYTWYNWKFRITAIDNKAPEQIGIAPAATTDYKKGDKVRFTVIYNELIDSASDANVDTTQFADYMPLDANSIKCVAGEGTNMLVFEGTASKDFSNTTWSGSGTNEELIKIKPVTDSSVIKDLKGNSTKVQAN